MKINKRKPPEKKVKTFKKITPAYLHNSGLYYLQRFAASSGGFRAVMVRKIQKSCMAHPEQNKEACAKMLDEVIAKFERAGLLNDEIFTRGVTSSLRRAGKSRRAIFSRLHAKGVKQDFAAPILEDFDEEWREDDADAEMRAAALFAKKKKLGKSKDNAKKDFAAMGRAGFSYDVARRVLNAEMEE